MEYNTYLRPQLSKRFIKLFLFTFLLFGSAGLFKSQNTVQPEKYFTFGGNLSGVGWSNVSTSLLSGQDYFTQTTNPGIGILQGVNGAQNISVIANSGIGIFGGFLYKGKHSNYTGIDLEVQRNRACYSFKYPFTYLYKGSEEGSWVDTDDYLKLSVALMRTFRLSNNPDRRNKSWYVRESFGRTFNHKNFSQVLHKDYTEDWTENGDGMKLKILNVARQSWMIGSEIGRKMITRNGRMFDIGIVYYYALSDTRQVQYEFFKNNTSTGLSTVTYHGSTFMLNLRYTITYKLKDKPIDTTKIIPFDDLAEKKNESDSTEIKHHDKIYHHHKVNGRRFEVQESMTVNSNVITVTVWDKNRVDGDEISLYLNEQLILENYTVSKTKKEIVLNLQPGKNILVMHALNLGRVPPNTAALKINDGTNNKSITLISDLKKSGAIEIIYNP